LREIAISKFELAPERPGKSSRLSDFGCPDTTLQIEPIFFATTVNSPSFADEYPQAQLICFILVYTISMEDESAYEWFCEQYDGNEIAQGLI
jgi:hypothetical protein